MRCLPRILVAACLGLIPVLLRAQDAAASPEPEPVAAPAPPPVEPAPGADAVLTAPSDPPPSSGGEDAAGTLEAPAATDASPSETAPAAPAASAVDIESLPSFRPSVPSVDVATASLKTVEEVSAGRASNWFFLAVLGLAAVLIVTRTTRAKSTETVSIQGDRTAGPFPAPAPGPPVVRRS